MWLPCVLTQAANKATEYLLGEEMNRFGNFILAVLAACMLFVTRPSIAQDSSNLPYMNPKLSPEQRAADLVDRMTLAEKASQMQNNSAAVPRLKVPAYQ